MDGGTDNIMVPKQDEPISSKDMSFEDAMAASNRAEAQNVVVSFTRTRNHVSSTRIYIYIYLKTHISQNTHTQVRLSTSRTTRSVC